MQEARLSLPVHVDGLTADWLTAALRQRSPGVTIHGVEIVDTIFSTASKIRLRLERNSAAIDAGIPEQVIVKGGFEEHGRKFANMHLREVRAYRDVLPFAPLPHPACYFADFDPDQRQGIVVLEDLCLRDVEFCHATRPQTFDAAAGRLAALAKFHASTWDSPELNAGGRWSDVVDFFAPIMKSFFHEKSSEENWARFMSMPRGAASSRLYQQREWMHASWMRMLEFSVTQPHCLLHGDMHLGNMYVEADGSPGFLDLQASHGPGLLEVAYFVSCAIDVADRRRWEGALVQHYLDELRRHGVDPPTFDEAMVQYAVFLLYGYFIWITTETHYQPESVNTANSMRSTIAMLDHNTAGVVASLPS